MCSVIGATPMPARDQPGEQGLGERAAGRGHLGAAGHGAEDGLVGRERVAAVEVAVGDRSAVPVEQRPQVALDVGAPQPVARAGGGGARVRVRRRAGSPAARPRRSSRPAAASRTGAAASGAVRSSTTQVPSSSRVAACSTIGAPPRTRVDLAVDGRGVVHHHQVAGLEQVGEVAEACGARCRPGRATSSRTSSRDVPAHLGRRRRPSTRRGRWNRTPERSERIVMPWPPPRRATSAAT